MTSIRLKVPGAIYFVSNVYSLFTGLAFTVIVTRSLTVSDFGFWTMISQYLAYTAIPLSNIASFWIVRYVARGFERAPKSGLIFGLMLSSIGFSLYLMIAVLAGVSFSQPIHILLLAAPQAITYVILGILYNIAAGASPIHVGISNIIFETLKVILAYVLVRMLKVNLTGAIISIILAQIIQLLYLALVFREIIMRIPADYNMIIKWIKLSWLPAYGLLPGLIGSLDAILARIISSTDALIGVKNVANIAGSFPRYAASLTLSLYPRTLGEFNIKRWEKDIEELLKFLSIIAIPITFGNIILVDMLLEIFGKAYVKVYSASIIFTIISLLGLFNSIVEPVLAGSETVDLKEGAALRDYLSSRLFKLITLNLISAMTYILIVTLVLLPFNRDIYYATFLWSLASFSGVPFLFYKIKMLREINVHFRLPMRNILKYVLASLFMSLLIYSLKDIVLDYFTKSIIGLLTGVTLLTIAGGCSYLVIVLLIDDYARRVVSQTIKLLKDFLKF